METVTKRYLVRRGQNFALVSSPLPLDNARQLLAAARLELAWLQFAWETESLAKQPRHDARRLHVSSRIKTLKREMPYLIDACYWQRLCKKLGPGIVD